MPRSVFALLAMVLLVHGLDGQPAVSAKTASPHAGTIPRACNKHELLALGRPQMLPGVHIPQLGLSMTATQYRTGEPVPLYIWAYNPTRVEAALWTCGDLDSFKARGFDVYDSTRRPLVRKREAEVIRQSRRQVDPCVGFPWTCNRNFPITIEPHTCVNGANYDFSTNLADQYDLPPGEYTVHPHRYGDKSETGCDATHPRFHKDSASDITFSIVAP
jgi:hypothetical protein